MNEKKHLPIGEVVRSTGLTERSLRFYEERGLVRPRRTAGGRRAYNSGDLMRISHIVLLRRMRFSLVQIQGLLDDCDVDARSVIDMQIESLDAERATIDASMDILRTARNELSEGRGVSLETLCELIRIGEQKMSDDAWQKIHARYYTPEELENWEAAKTRLAADFDQARYEGHWRDLARRIQNALPLDPSSGKAAAFLDEWNALLEPFLSVADDDMKAGANRVWQHMDEWSDQVDSPISKEVWAFIAAAAGARTAT